MLGLVADATGGVDHASEAAFDHPGHEVIADGRNGDGIDAEADIEIFDRRFPKVSTVADLYGGVVEDDVDLRALRVDFVEHGDDLLVLGEFCGDDDCLYAEGLSFRFDFCAMFGVAAMQDEVGSLFRHEFCGEVANAAARSRDEGPFVFKVYHGFVYWVVAFCYSIPLVALSIERRVRFIVISFSERPVLRIVFVILWEGMEFQVRGLRVYRRNLLQYLSSNYGRF